MSSSPKDLTEALRKLMQEQSGAGQEPMAARGGAPSSRSAAAPGGGPGKSGGGVASPLTELNSSLREYYPAGWTTTDGLFTFPAIKRLVMSDANDNSVVFDFAQP